MIDLNNSGIYIYRFNNDIYIGQASLRKNGKALLNRLEEHHKAAYVLNEEEEKKDSTIPLLRQGMVWNDSVKIYCWNLSDFKKNKELQSIFQDFSKIWKSSNSEEGDKGELDFWELMLVTYSKFFGKWNVTNKDFGGSLGSIIYEPDEKELSNIVNKYKLSNQKNKNKLIKLLSGSNQIATIGGFTTQSFSKIFFPIVRVIIKDVSELLEEDIMNTAVEVLSDYTINEISETITSSFENKRKNRKSQKKAHWKKVLRKQLLDMEEEYVKYFSILEEFLELQGNSGVKGFFKNSIEEQFNTLVNDFIDKVEKRLKKTTDHRIDPKDFMTSINQRSKKVSMQTVFGSNTYFTFKLPEIDFLNVKLPKDHWIYRLEKIDVLGLMMKQDYCINKNKDFINVCQKVMKDSYEKIRTISISSTEKSPALVDKIKENYETKVFKEYSKEDSVFIKNIGTFYIERETFWAKEHNSFFEKIKYLRKEDRMLVKKINEEENIVRSYYFRKNVWIKVEDTFKADKKITIW